MFKCKQPQCSASFKERHKLERHAWKHFPNRPRPHPCSIPGCGKSFVESYQLRNHKTIHHPTTPRVKSFKCIHCTDSFYTKAYLEGHISWKHSYCQICDVDLKSASGIAHHETVHENGDGVIKCHAKNCSLEFSTPSEFRDHWILNHAAKRDKPCPHPNCGKMFATAAHLQRHIAYGHGRTDSSTELTCATCHKRFPNKLKLWSHKTDHLPRNHGCYFCSKRYRTLTQLRDHFTVHTTEAPYFCKVSGCGVSTSTPTGLAMHTRQKHGDGQLHKSWPCYFCFKNVKRFARLSRHMNSHTRERPEVCKMCSKSYKSKEGLKYHVISAHTLEKPCKCDICGKAFSCSSILMSHKRIHSDRKAMSCDIDGCNFVTFSASGLYTHRKRHAPRSFKCIFCSRKFITKTELKCHTQRIHVAPKPSKRPRKPTEADLICLFCKKILKTRTHLRDHIATHTGERLYPCPAPGCGLSFQNGSSLKNHRDRIHIAKEYPCKAHNCGKLFFCQTSLNRHEKHYHKDPPSKCTQCNKSFITKAILRRHIKIVHSSNRPFPCPRCDLRFKMRIHLKAHINNLHTDKETLPHGCYFCGRSFPNSFTLNDHILDHTMERPEKCGRCGKEFKTAASLKAHTLRVHEGKKEGHPCPECDIVLRNEEGLRVHLSRMHNFDEAKFKICLFCKMKFKTNYQLCSHITRRHTLEKAFKCGRCGREFKGKSDLKLHKVCVPPGEGI